MILRCTISYTTPDGAYFEAGQLYTMEAEEGLWLLAVAAGQFALEEDGALDPSTNPVEGFAPPADRQVGEPPAGGAPKSRKR